MRVWMTAARKSAGLTMKEAGEKLGISESYYSLIERGDRQKSLDMSLVSRMSALFGLTLQYIVDQETAADGQEGT